MSTYLFQTLLKAACYKKSHEFYKKRHDLEKTQRAKLSSILAKSKIKEISGINTWEDFAKHAPITQYADWSNKINAAKNDELGLIESKLIRYQPTSGSSEKIKFIPYTEDFLAELDSAICPWLFSMFKKHPSIANGTHYWSVSWLPKNQFAELSKNINDDSELLGKAKRWILSKSQAVPADVALAATPVDSLFATLCYLVADGKLSVISVWSPTFALQLFDLLLEYQDEIAQVLVSGHWGSRAESLARISAPKNTKRAKLLQSLKGQDAYALVLVLWPNLALISAWDTADAAPWAEKIKRNLPAVAFEGKGLWATEGVVTIPVDDQYPLAYLSHFYEFEMLNSGKIVAPWQLKEGDEVSPILTTSTGMLRYAMNDCLKVTGFYGDVPCFSFLGRKQSVDMVGEKMSTDAARQVIQNVAVKHNLEPVTLLALASEKNGQSSYLAIFSSKSKFNYAHMMDASHALECALNEHFHYALARDLNQLQPAQAWIVEDGWKLYQDLAMANGMIEGNIKPEALKKMPKKIAHSLGFLEMEAV